MIERNRECLGGGVHRSPLESLGYSREEKTDELRGEAVNPVERRGRGLADRPQKARFARSRITERRFEDFVNFPSGEDARHSYPGIHKMMRNGDVTRQKLVNA